jgi:hypothetical protein
MEFKKQLVTPALANQYLSTNIDNRRLRMPDISRYAQDMASGRWKEDTGEVLKISKQGIVLDGQHRLLAVIKSNIPVNFHIAFDVDESVFDVLDTGITRSASDVFHVKNIKYENIIPTIISAFTVLNTGLRISSGGKSNRPTNALLLEAYYKKEKFWQMVAYKALSWHNAFGKILSTSMLGSMFALFYNIDAEQAEQFMEELATGMNLSNNTIALLRQKLIQDKTSVKKMSLNNKQALILKTWNFFRKGEEVKTLRFNTVMEDFPVAI